MRSGTVYYTPATAQAPRSGTVYYTHATAQAPSKVWGPKRVRQEGLSAHGVLSLVQVLKL